MAKITTTPAGMLLRGTLRRMITWRGTALKGVLLALIMSTACSPPDRGKVVAAKEFTPLERARQMLEGYAVGDRVGSEFMGFHLLQEELVAKNPAQAELVGAALAAIEKSMLQPAEVKAIAQRTLAELDAQAAPTH